MAKDKLTEYSATNASNDVIGDISVAEGMLPSAVNNALREQMTHLKNFSDGTDAIDALAVDNLKLDVNTISSTDTNGDITLDPNGTGDVVVAAVLTADGLTVDGTAQIGSGTAKVKFYSDSTYSGIFNGASLGSNENFYMGAGSLFFYGGGTERMRINSSGNVGIGETAPDAKLRITGSSTGDTIGIFTARNTNADAAACVASFVTQTNSTATSNVLIRFGINNYASGSGMITANGASAAAFGSFSDRRLKENIVNLPPQLDNILALRPVEFDYIESEGGGHQISFIAQEVEEIYPDVVGEREDGMKTLTGWDKTTARLVKAIQEQQEIITALEARLTALEAGE